MNTNLETTFDVNAKIAAGNRENFNSHHVTVVNILGPTGTGKTSIIESIAKKLHGSIRVAAIIGNLAAGRNAQRLIHLGLPTIAVETDNLTAYDVRQAMAGLDLDNIDLLLIESTGNNLSPIEFDLGQDHRIAIFSVAGGDERALEHSRLISESNLVLLTKIDLAPLVDFDVVAFSNSLADVHPEIEMLHVSGRNGCGINALVKWLAQRSTRGASFPGFRAEQRLAWFHGGELS